MSLLSTPHHSPSTLPIPEPETFIPVITRRTTCILTILFVFIILYLLSLAIKSCISRRRKSRDLEPPALESTLAGNGVGYGTFSSPAQYQVRYQDVVDEWERNEVVEHETRKSSEIYVQTTWQPSLTAHSESSGIPKQDSVAKGGRSEHTICGKLSDEDLAITREKREAQEAEVLRKKNRRVRFAGLPVNDYGIGSMEKRREGGREAPPPYDELVCLKCGMVCENCEGETGVEGKERNAF